MKLIVSFQTGNVLKMTLVGHGDEFTFCCIIVFRAINLLWMWIVTFWLHIVSSLHYKVSRYAWPYETLCLAVIGWNPTQASIGTLWPNVLLESTVAKLSCFLCFLWSASMFLLYLHRFACSADVNFGVLIGNLANHRLLIFAVLLMASVLLLFVTSVKWMECFRFFKCCRKLSAFSRTKIVNVSYT